MAGAAAIAAAVVSTGYNVYKGATAKSPSLAALNPPNAAQQQMQADVAAINAGAKQRKKAAATAAQNNTVLTGPEGVPAPATAPAAKTLLGL